MTNVPGGVLRRALLTINTARYLSPSQLVYWPLRQLQRHLPARLPQIVEAPHAERVEIIRECAIRWPVDEAQRLRRADEVLYGAFQFLKHTEQIDTPRWQHRYVSHLWNYHLHYFEFAVDLAWAWHTRRDERYLRRLEELCSSWVASTAPGRGDGWDAYPISVRSVNWMYSLALTGNSLDDKVAQQMWASVWRQLCFLSSRLEHHLRANHLQRNYKALFIGGLAFKGSRARHWMNVGKNGLWRELAEQVNDDGGHFERSPLYHATVLADYLEVVDLARACNVEVSAASTASLRRMTQALSILTRPDHTVQLFNDAAEGIVSTGVVEAQAEQVLGARVSRVGGAAVLPDTAFHAYTDEVSGSRIVIDAGAPSPSYQPGHAHCCLLSFELDVGAHRFIVDSGIAGYADHPLRGYARSTRAHNTVMIDGREQSEIWGSFRIGRRATVEHHRSSASPERWVFSGRYCPYHGKGTHERTIVCEAGIWTITDTVHAADGAPLSSFIHLHPDFEVSVDGTRIVARAAHGSHAIEVFGADRVVATAGDTDPPQGWYMPAFGVAVAAPVVELVVDRSAGKPFGYRVMCAR